jgi:predicted TIM-barrel fold metal-dependent hydrolase
LTFIGHSLFGHSVSANELIHEMDELGIDQAIVCPMKPRTYQLAEGNDAVAEAAAKYPGRLVGFGRVDPWLGDDAVSELIRALDDGGLRGLYLNPWEETFQIALHLVDPLLQVLQQRRLPVIVASGYPWLSEGLQVGELASRFPDVPVVATNGCQFNISGLGTFDADLAMAGNANVAIQTTGVYREDFLEGVVKRYGSERVMYASGFPFMDPRLEILRVSWAHFDEAEQASILAGNAQRLLDSGR